MFVAFAEERSLRIRQEGLLVARLLLPLLIVEDQREVVQAVVDLADEVPSSKAVNELETFLKTVSI